MPTLEAAASLPREKGSGIRWKRIVLAAFLSEICVIGVLIAVTAVYAFGIAPGRTDEEYQRFSETAGYYVAPAAGALTTFLFALWVATKLDSRFIANGVLVGVISVLLTAGFLVGARPEHRPMYLIAFALRIAAGYLGGYVDPNEEEPRMIAHVKFVSIPTRNQDAALAFYTEETGIQARHRSAP